MPPFRIEWLDEASRIRRLDRATAMRVFDVVLRFAETGVGDAAPLRGRLAGGFRLRAGDYRVLFRFDGETLVIFNVRHRSEAYQ